MAGGAPRHGGPARGSHRHAGRRHLGGHQRGGRSPACAPDADGAHARLRGCAADGLGARVSWTPSSDPTALTYTAQLVSPASGLSIVSNGVTISPGLLDGLLGGLLGTALTVRVTASLPGTSWSVSTDRVVYYKLVILVPTVSCSP